MLPNQFAIINRGRLVTFGEHMQIRNNVIAVLPRVRCRAGLFRGYPRV